MNRYINIAADDIESLRQSDVYRVLDSAPRAVRSRLAKWISTNRPEMVCEVLECMSDINR